MISVSVMVRLWVFIDIPGWISSQWYLNGCCSKVVISAQKWFRKQIISLYISNVSMVKQIILHSALIYSFLHYAWRYNSSLAIYMLVYFGWRSVHLHFCPWTTFSSLWIGLKHVKGGFGCHKCVCDHSYPWDIIYKNLSLFRWWVRSFLYKNRSFVSLMGSFIFCTVATLSWSLKCWSIT